MAQSMIFEASNLFIIFNFERLSESIGLKNPLKNLFNSTFSQCTSFGLLSDVRWQH